MPNHWDRRRFARDLGVGAVFLVLWLGGMAWSLSHGWYPYSSQLYLLAGLWTSALLAVGSRWQRTLFLLTLVGYPLAWGGVGPYFGMYQEMLLLPMFVVSYRVAAAGRLAIRWVLPLSLLVPSYLKVRAVQLYWGLDPLYMPLFLAELDVSKLLFEGAVMAGLVLLGRAEHRRRQALAQLAARNSELERLRRVEAEQVVAAERTRIARELHDVVAHHVSAIVVRSQAADRAADRRPHEPREAIRWIATAGQEALTSMRRVVEVLHTPASRPASSSTSAHAPRARLSELPDIAARVTDAGVPVKLTVDDLPPIPAHVELAALRIVQESLTNVLLHAEARQAQVDVRCSCGWLLVVVNDDGQQPEVPGITAATDTVDGVVRTGNGLPGMHARAVLCGGTLSVGAGPLGGWQIFARLPLHPGRDSTLDDAARAMSEVTALAEGRVPPATEATW